MRPPDGWKIKRDSAHTLWMNLPVPAKQRVRYSQDWKSPLNKDRDDALGLKRLRKLIATKNPEIAIIYKIGTKHIVEYYIHGKLDPTRATQ